MVGILYFSSTGKMMKKSIPIALILYMVMF